MELRTTIAVIASVLLVLESCAGYDPATRCRPEECQLPDCKCAGSGVPGGLDPVNIPQIVLLTFEDSMSTQIYYPFYQPLFNYKNPNGCNIGITYFLAHEYTNYILANQVYNQGHELASHSITHKSSSIYWMDLDYQGWIDEMYGQKQIISKFANIPLSDIEGTRAVSRILDGDTTFSALDDSGFKYDNTIPSPIDQGSTLWPFTLDYKINCEEYWTIDTCPTDSFPGFWEVPLDDYNSTSGTPCDMLSTCPTTNTTNSTFDFLLYNFNTHYHGNRAPFSVATDTSWFETDPSHYSGYIQFIEYLGTLSDVYLVTVTKAIQWMQQPTNLSDITSFAPWSCDILPDAPCTPIDCFYNSTPPGGERYMGSCVACPPHYPWLNDPYGNATVTKK